MNAFFCKNELPPSTLDKCSGDFGREFAAIVGISIPFIKM
jgi:hypothetical protein